LLKAYYEGIRVPDVGLEQAFAGRYIEFSTYAAGDTGAHVEDHDIGGAGLDRGPAEECGAPG
jgi:hypothetical protein